MNSNQLPPSYSNFMVGSDQPGAGAPQMPVKNKESPWASGGNFDGSDSARDGFAKIGDFSRGSKQEMPFAGGH